MNHAEEYRPDPDELLSALKKEEEQSKRGKLKIFFGMCAGVGKTYDMLRAAHEAKTEGIDVVVGWIETHNRPETKALLPGLTILPRKKIKYRDILLEETDLDAILLRKPRLVLIDELAHTNAPGSRHTKRFQDIQELLENGIDVYSTLNVQHLESRADTVAQITTSIVRETVPDSIFDLADEVELVDLSPEELLKRLEEGKVYTHERSQQAVQKFFRKGNLTALREMSLRFTAERVDRQLRDYMQTQQIRETWKSGQRFLVGISPSPTSVTVIRWARRIAYAMNATWMAVYVESSKPLSEKEKQQLHDNIKLARELGAEIITTADEDVAAAMVRIARQQNATQIIAGKTTRHPFLKPALLDEIIRQCGNLDVFVIGEHESEAAQKRLFMFPRIHSHASQYGFATLAVFFVALLCYPLAHYLGYQTVALLFLLTIALLPLQLGVGPVLLAATLSALLWDFLFIPPRYTFAIGKPQDILMLVTYFAFALVTSVLTARIRARERTVRQREEHATALYTLTKNLITARTQDEVAEVSVRLVSSFFDSEVVLYVSDMEGEFAARPHPASTLPVNEKESSVASWVYWNEKKAGKFTDTLPSAEATYYPISGPRYSLGVMGVRHKDGKQFSVDQESLLQNFIAQIASAIEREQLLETAKRTVVYAESEKLYKTLFNSISHELRTPIAAIISASEALQSVAIKQANSLSDELTQEIHTAADRLNRLVENLLDMTRLESGQLKAKMDWCDVRDIINTSIKKLEEELSRHTLTISIAENVPLVKMDFILMEQVMKNILHNAALYTPTGSLIEIKAHADDRQLEFIISDNGPGFPAESLKKLFEKFYRIPGTKAGGTGLGLSIARGFVDAHKGTIDAANNPNGGAQFTIRIPIEQSQSVQPQ